MRKMFRFRGHFYNWYDTRDLRPLDPQYVSSVDSGNLAGHLIALANACEAAIATPLTDERRRAGIEDSVALVREAIDEHHGPRDVVDSTLAAFAAGLWGAGKKAPAWPALEQLAGDLAASVRGQSVAGSSENPAALWAEASLETVRSHIRDVSVAPPSIVERLTAVRGRGPEEPWPS